LAHPPGVEPWGLADVGDGACVAVDDVTAADEGVVAVGETASVGVGLAGVLARAVVSAVAVGGREVAVRFCWLVGIIVGVGDAAIACVRTGVALGETVLDWVRAGWPAGASVIGPLFEGIVVEVFWTMQAARDNATGIRKKNRFTLPGAWNCMEAVRGELRLDLALVRSNMALMISLSMIGRLPVEPLRRSFLVERLHAFPGFGAGIMDGEPVPPMTNGEMPA
jgi:hypothetical protein